MTVSVAPPGPPAVTLMTMSASFSLKMMRMTTAVTLTGSISGKVTCQKLCQPLAPSTLAASSTSFGIACSPASSRIIMNGIEDPGVERHDGEAGDPRRGEEGGVFPAEMARQAWRAGRSGTP